MKAAVSPVSSDDAEAFDKYILQWQKNLNLMDWRVVRSKKPSKSMAEVTRELGDRLATYKMGTDFGAETVTPYTLETTAVHELLHVFLHELIELAKDSATNADVLMSAEHRVINVLTPLLVKQ